MWILDDSIFNIYVNPISKVMFGNIFSKTVYFLQIFWLNFYRECFQALPADGFRHSSRLKNFFQNVVFNTGFPYLSLMIKILTLIRCKSSFSSFVQKKAGGRGRGRGRQHEFSKEFSKKSFKRGRQHEFSKGKDLLPLPRIHLTLEFSNYFLKISSHIYGF